MLYLFAKKINYDFLPSKMSFSFRVNSGVQYNESHVGRQEVSHVGRQEVSHVGRQEVSHVGRQEVSHVGRQEVSHVGRQEVSPLSTGQTPSWNRVWV